MSPPRNGPHVHDAPARSARPGGGASARGAGAPERRRLTRWFIVEDVTVSLDSNTPGYRLMTDREIEPFPEAWLAAGEGFDSREAADAALVALRESDAAPVETDPGR